MDIDWAGLAGALGIALVVVVIWAAFKLMKRLVAAFIFVVLLAVVFTGAHFGELPFG